MTANEVKTIYAKRLLPHDERIVDVEVMDNGYAYITTVSTEHLVWRTVVKIVYDALVYVDCCLLVAR